MSQRFTATKATTLADLRRVMEKMKATSLHVDQGNMMYDGLEATITFDRNGKRYISKCSRWNRYLDNLRAAQLAIEYTWRIAEGYGVDLSNTGDENLVDQIFAALEAPLDPNILLLGDGNDSWWEVLGVRPDASRVAIINAYRALAKVHHPDVGGNPEDFTRLRTAYEKGIQESK